MNYEGRALTIAGFDPSGGAGIQADLKTFQALKVYGASVVTSIAVENTSEVREVFDLPPTLVEEQINVVLDDVTIDATKLGMLSSEEIIKIVSNEVKNRGMEKLVVDPVMVAKTGGKLLREGAEKTFIREIVPLAFVITPNLPESEVISGMKVKDEDDARKAAELIHGMGAKNVVLKGGHFGGSRSTDILFDGENYSTLEALRIDTKNTHGTGCTFSAAIAAELARGMGIHDAVKIAKDYTTRAIKNAPVNIGKGYGPLYHNVEPMRIPSFEVGAEDFDIWFEKNRIVFESELLAQKHFLTDPKNSVSIGVGSGLFASMLGVEYGVEPSKEMAELAKERGIRVKIGTAENVPFEDGRFDTALLSTVLSYVDDPQKAVREAYRVLKPHGMIVVSFLAREGSYAMMYDLAYLKGKHDPVTAPEHPYPIKFIKEANWCSVSKVGRWLKKAGFVDLKCVQTLTNHPKYTNDEIERPIEGYKKGDYVVIRGMKNEDN